jgi:aminoglycoside 2'-N-acetyltransferase I
MKVMGAQHDERIRRMRTDELTAAEIESIKDLMLAAFAEDEHGGFTEEDWQHSIGGTHFVLQVEGAIVCHASVVQRDLHVAGVPLRTGYVEAVATAPEQQRRGYGSAVMRDVNDYVAAGFELGALGTGSQAFYERLGWHIWRGPTFVRTATGDEPTADEDGYILVLPTPASPALDMTAPISCEWRPGDVW